MKTNRFNLGRLFYNNKVVMLFSVIFAFIFWVILSTSASESTTKLISDIPIQVSLSESAKESGLTVFGVDEIRAEISVTGNRLILGQLSKNDILVTAAQSANMITSVGTYTLELCAKKNSILTDYDFTSSVSPKFITVVVDRFRSQTFDITPNIKFSANPDYFVPPIALSDAQIEISGPESVVSSIASVTVEGNIPGILNRTAYLNDLPINLLDAAGNKINTTNLTLSVTKVNATVAILQRKFVNVKPEFTGVPAGLNVKSLPIAVTPAKIEIAAPADVIGKISDVSLEPIDFSQVNLDNCQFEPEIKLPSDCRNLSSTTHATVKMNLLGFQARTVAAKNIRFKNVPDGKSATSSSASLNITVIGPIAQLRTLSDGDVSAEIDLSGKEDFVGRTEMPAKIVFSSGTNKCWAYGSYGLTVSVAKK